MVAQVTVVPPSAHGEHSDTCYRWVDQPAIWYSGTHFDHLNIYHFLCDNLVPLLTTARGQGWFDMEKFLARCVGVCMLVWCARAWCTCAYAFVDVMQFLSVTMLICIGGISHLLLLKLPHLLHWQNKHVIWRDLSR